MKQSVYVLAMTMYPVFFDDEHGLDDHLVGFSADGCLIQACHYYSDPYMYQILHNLNQRNTPPSDDSNDYVQMNFDFIELVIESEHDLRYKTIPWLNDRIRSHYSVSDHFMKGGYFFYVTGSESCPMLEIVAQLKNADFDIDETNSGDDFTYIIGLARFIDRYIYYGDAEEYFADTMAKLILQFG